MKWSNIGWLLNSIKILIFLYELSCRHLQKEYYASHTPYIATDNL